MQSVHLFPLYLLFKNATEYRRNVSQIPPVHVEKFGWAFDAASWDECVQSVVYLTQPFRQTDMVFYRALEEMRVGVCSEECENLMRATYYNEV